ncbi:hypothetical protein IRJ41_013186 [Triplophysa rosa]|uniref:Uncharacterized protein n=1 Tax=Triplophysa rosa TaxID=992332 RepID=A0A9W7WFC8_TRIRA|nr:hypothetical protein IRJ41_013186 [Triplophysa rosa]
MASPAKVQTVDENTVEGFIFSVSPRTYLKDSNSFFSAVIQSARQEYHRVIVFSMDKQAMFTQAAKNGFSDEDGYDVLCSRATRLEVTSLPFLPCAPPSSKRLTIAEVKALGPKQQVGEVCGKVKVHDSVSKPPRPRNPTPSRICAPGTGMRVHIPEHGPVQQITNLNVVEDESEGSQQASRSTAILSAKVKAIKITIQRLCPSCHARQTEFIEKSVLHLCEGCRLMQSSLAFVASFSGKPIVGTDNGEDTVVLISSPLLTYLRGSGLGSLLNDAEAIEDHLLQSPGLDLTVNSDGFLPSMQRAAEAHAPSDGASSNSDGSLQQAARAAGTATVGHSNNSDGFLLEMLELAEVAEPPASSQTSSGTSST